MSIENLVRKYIDFWTAPPPKPRSISFLETAAERIGVRWRPSGDSIQYIAHQSATDESRFFENQLADYDPSDPRKSVDEAALEKANLIEIRHRIFKSIYWGNLYDDLMPIESRSFTTTGQRKAKLTLMVIIACMLYSMVYFLPSVAYKMASEENAIFQTSQQKLSAFSTMQIARFYQKELKSLEVDFPEIRIRNPETALIDSVNYRENLLTLVKESAVYRIAPSESPLWLAAGDTDRQLLIADVLFFLALTNDANALRDLNGQTQLVTVPASNLVELFSQLALLSATMILISWFLSKKNHYFSVFERIDYRFRVAAVLSLEETIQGGFFFRKKFHYAVSLGIAAIVILLHYYTIDTRYHSLSIPAANLLDLRAYDYRVTLWATPVVFVNWSLQILLAYTLVLVCWELKLLNKCMKDWQVKICEMQLMPDNDYDDFFQSLNEKQYMHGITLVAIIGTPLLFSSLVKYWNVQAPISVSEIGLDRWRLSAPIASISELDVWAIWSAAYIFSPPILFCILIVMTGRTCLPTIELTKKYKGKRAIDLDASVEYVLKRGEKVVVLRNTWVKLQEELGTTNTADAGSSALNVDEPPSQNVDRC